MKNLFFLGTLFFAGQSQAGVSLSVVPQQAYLQNTDITGDCGYRSSPTITFSRVTLSFSGAGSFIPSHLNLKILDASFQDGKYLCNVSGEAFEKLFGDKRIELHDGEKVTSSCPLMCGSVNPNPPIPNVLYGKAKIYGFDIDENGASFPAVAEQEVQVLSGFERALQFSF